jgi:predicted transcriptional regulator
MTLQAKLDFLFRAVEDNPGFFERLPKAEQNLYELHIVKKFNQKEIASLLGVTQGAISSRLSKIVKRLEFMQKLSKFDLSEFENKLRTLFDPFEIELLRGMLETTCQSETARRLNVLFNLMEKCENVKNYNAMTQVKVRHRFEKCLLKMQKENHPYFDLFSFVKKNLYIMHEVKLSHFSRRNCHE